MEPLLKSQDNPDHSVTSSTTRNGIDGVVGEIILMEEEDGKWMQQQHQAHRQQWQHPRHHHHHNPQHFLSNPSTFIIGAASSPSSLSSSIAMQYVPLSSPQGSSSAGSSSGTSHKSFVFCRICHEGDLSSGNCSEGSPSLSYTSQVSSSSQNGSRNNNNSSGGRPRRGEALIAPCHCTGSVAMVHLSCLEHWLTTSNSDKCELCHFIYKTKKIPRTWTEFLTERDNQFNVRNMIADLICFFLLTPLLVVSTYLCCIGAHEYYLRERWEAVGLVTLSIFLLMVYFTWCQVTLKYHVGVWRSWIRTHQRIRITFGETSSSSRFFRRRRSGGAAGDPSSASQSQLPSHINNNNNNNINNLGSLLQI